jgi:hypothetical protein
MLPALLVIMGMVVVEVIHLVEQVYLPMVVTQIGAVVKEADTHSLMAEWVVI